MAFCLSKVAVDEFKRRLLSGEITPEKLNDMSSKERREYFKGFLGDFAAGKVNALYESKLLLKNQQQGIITWANTIMKSQPKAYKDIISQVEKMTEVLNPKSEDLYYADLARQKLGFGLSMEEAAHLHSLSTKATELKTQVSQFQSRQGYSDKTATTDEIAKRMEYGHAVREFNQYYEQLKTNDSHIPLKDYFKPDNAWKVISSIPGLAKSMKASLDDSIIGRQGLKVGFYSPDLWGKYAVQSFKDIADTFVGRDVLGNVLADALSRKNAVNGRYKEIKLDVNVREEAYPKSVADLLEQVPLAKIFFKYFSKGFKASEVAFRAFQIRTRVDLADRLLEVADKTNGDIRGIGTFVNSLTGRGDIDYLVKGEGAKRFVNETFFSPRLVQSNIDLLTGHLFNRNMGKTARQEAAWATIRTIGGIAIALTIAKMINPDSVEEDARSSDFGKIKVGSTRFDVSGGMSGLVTLAMRIARWSEKSSMTGVVRPLGSGTFDNSVADLFMNFAGNKLSPSAAVIKDALTQKDFQGRKPTFASSTANLLAPLPITTYLELKKNPDSANILAAMLLEFVGIGTNTYSYSADWSESEGKQIVEFRETVGEARFKAANEKFNQEMNKWLEELKKKPEYKNLDGESQSKIILNKKLELKKKIFEENGFYPKKTRTNLPKF